MKFQKKVKDKFGNQKKLFFMESHQSHLPESELAYPTFQVI